MGAVPPSSEKSDAEAKIDDAEAKVETAEAAQDAIFDLNSQQTALVNEAHEAAAMPEGPERDEKKAELLDSAAKLDQEMSKTATEEASSVADAKAATDEAVAKADEAAQSDAGGGGDESAAAVSISSNMDTGSAAASVSPTAGNDDLVGEKALIEDKKLEVGKLGASSEKSDAEGAIDEAEDMVHVAEKVAATLRELNTAKNTLEVTTEKIKSLPDSSTKNARSKAIPAFMAKLDGTRERTQSHYNEALTDVKLATEKMVQKVKAATEAGQVGAQQTDETEIAKVSEHHGKLVNAVQVGPFPTK